MTDFGLVTTPEGVTATELGGAYIPPRSLGELTNFIIDLKECAEQ